MVGLVQHLSVFCAVTEGLIRAFYLVLLRLDKAGHDSVLTFSVMVTLQHPPAYIP